MADSLLPDVIEQKILVLRAQRVMLDRDLALLYGVETKYLNRQVKRNPGRFPSEFMFQLTERERDEVVTIWHHLHPLKFSHSRPFAFTEHGVAMLASVLNSERAVRISVGIVQAFVKLRRHMASQAEFARKLARLENQVERQDVDIKSIFDAIRNLMEPPPAPKRKIGFQPGG